MAEEDDASKTEDPTEKKLGDAKKKGEVSKSVEINSWFILVGGAASLIVFAPYIAQNISLKLALQLIKQYLKNLMSLILITTKK